MEIDKLFNSYSNYNNRIHRPYIIAEAGVNHEGDMELAKRLIDEAIEGGADAIKFQTYKAEYIASENSPAYWDTNMEKTRSQFELFKKYDKFWKKEYELLKLYCDNANIEFLSTPFDIESARFLNDLMPVFKISSSDINNKPFIEFICNFNKPIILSTGAAYLSEIQEAVEWIDIYGNKLALLHCVLNYPTDDKNANLGMITTLKDKFSNCIIGYSDHTLPHDMKVSEIAFLLGAEIIEKHFTHDKFLPGNDHYHAMDKSDLKKFIDIIDRDMEILGSVDKKTLDNEIPARINARRSLVAANKIKAGEKIKKEDLTFKRPGTGVNPKFIDEVIGKIAINDIDEDELIKWNLIK